MRRRRVEVEVLLLDILAVVAFLVRQTEEAFLEDRVTAIPQSETEAQPLFVIAEAGKGILAPAEGALMSVIEWEIRPGVAVRRVVLANGSPGAVGKVRPPAGPVGGRIAEPVAFGADGHGSRRERIVVAIGQIWSAAARCRTSRPRYGRVGGRGQAVRQRAVGAAGHRLAGFRFSSSISALIRAARTWATGCLCTR